MRVRLTVFTIGLASLLCSSAATAATVTVGSPLSQQFEPTKFNTVASIAMRALAEPGAHVAVPFAGTIVRWRVDDASGGPFTLQVLRHGDGGFQAVAASQPALPVDSSIQTFAASLPVLPGDLIAIRNSNETDRIGTISPLEGSAFSAWVPPLEIGETRQPTELQANLEVAFDADVQPPPAVTGISPASGSFKGGTAVTIAGTDFAGVSQISFGGVPASSFMVNSEGQIVAPAPPGAPGAAAVTVTTVAGTSAAGAADQFTYTACRVPKLKGKKLKPAKKKLARAGCRIGKVRRGKGVRAKRGRVVKQRPRPGKQLAPGSRVAVKLGQPGARAR